jgi:site-specific DNA-methyltransferase (adenine-specific)
MTPFFQDSRTTIYNGEVLDVLLQLDNVGAIITDPPYSSGGQFRGDRAQSTVTKYVQSATVAYRPEFAGDSRDQRSFFAWMTLWLSLARVNAPEGAPIAIFTDWRQLPIMSDALQAGGWTWRGIAIWDKGYGRPTPGRFSNAAEYLLYGSNGPMAGREVYPPGIFHSPSVKDKLHIAQKPEDVMRWALSIVPPGATVVDPFMGSGSTLRAALDLGFDAVGIELDPHYCEIARDRLGQQVLDFGGAS